MDDAADPAAAAKEEVPRLDDPRIAALAAPLPADHPDPAAFRYDPDYEALEGEIRKLEREGPAAVAWPAIVRGAEAILRERARDLAVMAWYALALAQTEGLRGAAVGLAVLRAQVEHAWDALYPPAARARQRGGIFDWLIPRLARALPEDVVPADGAAALSAAADADALERLLETLLPTPPAWRDVTRRLRPLADAARAAAAEAEAAAARAAAQAQATHDAAPAGGEAAPAPAPAAASPAARPATLPVPAIDIPVVADGDGDRAVAAVREAVRGAALALRGAAPADWRAYALLRAVTWIGITEPPPARDGRTELMPPPAMRLDEFNALRGAGNWPDLLDAVERFCSGSGPFWLDGQRIAAQALAAMGPDYAACVREVSSGTAAFVGRLPGIAALCFSDGTPFADAATQAWLAGLTPAGRDGAGAGHAGAADGPRPWDEALARARADAAGGTPEAAVAALAAAVRGDGRDWFCWRLALTSLCLETGAAPLALALAQELDGIARARRLAQWEPALAAQASLLLHRCLGSPDAQALLAEDARGRALAAAFTTLARSDPAAAWRLGNKPVG